jgi:ribose transport system permease protein
VSDAPGIDLAADAAGTPSAPRAGQREPRARRFLSGLSFSNIGAVYVWIVIVAIFWIWVPSTFPTGGTVKAVLNDSAVTGLVALALTVPLAARIFDLSVVGNLGLCNMFVAYLFAHTSLSIGVIVLLTLLLALVVGAVNVLVVVVMKIDSFIGTLATGALLEAANTLISKEQPVNSVRLSAGFQKISSTQIIGVTIPVLYMIAIAAAVWVMLEHTATGRRLYATGFNADAARLAGVQTSRLRAMTLMFSALIAGIAGIVVTATVGSGSPGIGPPYLLVAFAAAFLGGTQLKGGRFNAWGTVIAVLMLGTGTEGLSLAAAPVWASSVFTGVTLIAALAVTGFQRGRVRGGAASGEEEPAAQLAGAG